VARPREAVGCRTLICRKADSGQLNDLTTRQSASVDLSAFEDSSRLVREKTRARPLQPSRFHHLCRFILGK
jgi:hypothetical protein